MKANEIRNMSVAELESKLVDLKKDLFMLRMQHATNHLDNPTKISTTRRDIARCANTGISGYLPDGTPNTTLGAGWQMFDAGIASEAFCLAAYEKGLGTVILGLFDVAEATALLEIPETQELVALICIGYPAENPDAPKRKTVTDLLTYKS